jgi:hypothetical protein
MSEALKWWAKNGQTVYYLVYATKHPKGMEVMKDAMWRVDRTGSYSFSDRTDPRQKYLFDFDNEASWIDDAAAKVLTTFVGRRVPLKDVKDYVIVGTPYRFQKSILKKIEENGGITNVTDRSRKGTFKDSCFITFA